MKTTDNKGFERDKHKKIMELLMDYSHHSIPKVVQWLIESPRNQHGQTLLGLIQTNQLDQAESLVEKLAPSCTS